jgi:hypothetical protein
MAVFDASGLSVINVATVARQGALDASPSTRRRRRGTDHHLNDNGAYVSLWRSVFERRAPESITAVEAAISTRIGAGNPVRSLSDEAFQALEAAYRVAAKSPGAVTSG